MMKTVMSIDMVRKCLMPLKFLAVKCYPKVLQNSTRQLSTTLCHSRKMFVEIENNYAYNTLISNGHFQKVNLGRSPPTLTEGLQTYLLQNWPYKSHQELCDAFGILAQYCSENNICISNKMFDNFIDCLTDNVQYFTDSQLEQLFLYLKLWPETESVKTRNFIEVWAALDDACIDRFKKWSTAQKLQFAALTFELKIARSCEYTFKCVQRLTTKASTLSVSELLLTSFFMSVLRHSPLDKHNIELYLEKHIDKFSIDDLAILSMGFFKSKSPIRNIKLVVMIIDKIIVEKDTLEDVPLTSLLKVIRYSYRVPESTEPLRRLMNALEGEVPRLSVMSCVHLALVGTTSMFLHPSSLNRILERVVADISETRVKDLERIILTLSLFNYQHPNIDFVSLALEELRKSERENEIVKYGRSYAQCIAYATLHNSFPQDHINRILDPSFLQKVYGEVLTNHGRELLVIDNSVEINCPDYTGHRLKHKVNKYLAKTHTDYIPDEKLNYQYNVSEKLILELMKILTEITGDQSRVCGDHTLPHHQRGDVFICRDSAGNFLDLSPHFPIKPFSRIYHAPTSDTWIAFVIAARNAYVKETGNLTGPLVAKCRDHKKIGYRPAVVSWYEWIKLQSKEEKVEYVLNLIKQAVN